MRGEVALVEAESVVARHLVVGRAGQRMQEGVGLQGIVVEANGVEIQLATPARPVELEIPVLLLRRRVSPVPSRVSPTIGSGALRDSRRRSGGASDLRMGLPPLHLEVNGQHQHQRHHRAGQERQQQRRHSQ